MNSPGAESAALPAEPPAKSCSAADAATIKRSLIIIVALAAVAVFSGSFRSGFLLWDDNINIYDNPHLRQGLSWEGLRWMFTDAQYIPRYMPLGWLSYAINYELGRFNPVGYHLGNLLFHGANAVLIFLLLLRVLPRVAPRGGTVRTEALLYGSAFGALLWAIHPLRVESVAWASARIYGQALLFLLVSTLSYLKMHDEGTLPPARRKWFWLSILSFLGSLLTYPLAMGFVVVLLAIDGCVLHRFPGGRDRWWNAAARTVWIEKIPFAAAVAAVLGLTLAARLSATVWAAPASWSDFTLAHRVMQAFYVWGYYIWKQLFPFNLSPTYTTLDEFNPWAAPFLLSALGVAGATAALLWKGRARPGLLALWLCYLALLVPVLGLTEHPHRAYDRYSYLVAILGSLLLSVAFVRVWNVRATRRFAFAMAAAMLVLCGAASVAQCRIWTSNHTLLPHIIAQLGDDPARAPQDLVYGVILMREGHLPEAEHSFRNAIRFNPKYVDAYANLGDVFMDQDKAAEAVPNYRRALELDPRDLHARQGLAVALGSLQQYEEAVPHFKEVLRIDPNNANAMHNLALTVAKLGQTNLARAYYARGKQLRQEQSVTVASAPAQPR